MKNKGQVTVFVIIGAVILLGAALFMFVNNLLSEEKVVPEVYQVSLEARPAINLIEECLKSTSKAGLKRIASQGGWLEFPGMKYNPLPYKSDMVDFAPYKIPYWRHLTDCDDPMGCEASFQVPLCKPGSKNCNSNKEGDYSIQEQLEKYVEDNIDSCLNGFQSLEKIYDIKATGEPKADVIFAKGSTEVILKYPIEMKSMKNDNIKMIDDFRVEFDIDFAGMYELANEIVKFEKSTNFYETQTVNLLSIYSGVDKELPPLSDVTFFIAGTTPWNQFEVRDLLQYDLLPYMGTILFMNSKNYHPIMQSPDEKGYSVYAQGVYMGMNPQLGNLETIYPFNVNHHYMYSPIYSKVGDGKAVIKPGDIADTSNPLISMMGLFLKDYRFSYDISYPLVVTINDDTSLNGEGFTLQFAIEVNVRNNLPAYENITMVNLPNVNIPVIDDEAMLLDQKITVETKDKLTGERLDDVIITYVCGNEYDMGVTKSDSFGKSILTTKLPYCEFGGFIRYNRDGYAGESIPYNNRIGGKDETFVLELWPLQEKEIIIKKRTVFDINLLETAGIDALTMIDVAATDIKANETAIMTFSKKLENVYDEEVPMAGFISYQTEEISLSGISYTVEDIQEQFDAEIIDSITRDALIDIINDQSNTETVTKPQEKYVFKLVPGEYEIDGSLFDYNKIMIPEHEEEVCPDDLIGSLICNEGPMVLPAQNFSMWIDGGVKTNITLTPNQIYNEKPITLYVLEMNLPNSWPDLMNSQEIDEYQKGKEFYVVPKVR